MLRPLNFQRRLYAALPSSRSAINYSRVGEQLPSAVAPIKMVTKTSSGVSVATMDQQGPLSSVALVIHAGSRHETQDNLGTAHLWKNSFIRDLPDGTVIKTIRENELRGDSLYTAATRENLVIASDFLRDDLPDVISEMVSNFINKSIQAHEFLDTRAQVINESEFALHDSSVQVMENLHAAAFRRGLGNTLFASEANVSGLKRAHMQEFSSKWFTPERVAIIGKDVNHRDLVQLVENAFKQYGKVTEKTATVEPTKYYGGERRVDTGSQSGSEYVLAFPSVAVSSQQYPTALVLTALLDGSKRLKWGPAASGLLAKAVAATSEEASVQAFNSSYSDAGLFGIHVVSENVSAVKPAVQTSIDILKSVATLVTESDLSRAKKAALVSLESSRDVDLIQMATRFFASKSIMDGQDLAEQISKVTAADVSKLVKSMLSGKPTVSAVGPTSLPYLDEFKF